MLGHYHRQQTAPACCLFQVGGCSTSWLGNCHPYMLNQTACLHACSCRLVASANQMALAAAGCPVGCAGVALRATGSAMTTTGGGQTTWCSTGKTLRIPQRQPCSASVNRGVGFVRRHYILWFGSPVHVLCIGMHLYHSSTRHHHASSCLAIDSCCTIFSHDWVFAGWLLVLSSKSLVGSNIYSSTCFQHRACHSSWTHAVGMSACSFTT